jgi:hypothetical protein
VTITPESLVGWWCIYSFWKGLKILYHFRIVRFFWFCTSLSQWSFARLSWLKTESELTFSCRRGLFWSFGLLPLFDGWNIDSFPPCFWQMDDYPYATLGADGWFHCDGLHRPGFPTLLRDVLHHFGYMGFPAYRGRLYRQFGLGRCKVHVDIPAHPTDLTMTAWFTMARGDDLDDTLERAAHQALKEFCEHHLPALSDTTIALLPVWNEGNAVWSERATAISDPESPTHHAGWALTARYA